MKKSVTVVAAAMAGALGFGSVAFATAPYPVFPSPTAFDLTKVWTIGSYAGSDNPDYDKTAVLVTDQSNDRYQDALDYIEQFDVNAVSDADNAAIFNVIEGENATVHEFAPLVLAEYDGGALNFKATFPTDYKYLLCQKVAVLITVYDAEGAATTYVVEGTVTDQGVVQFHVNADCAAAINAGTAFMAIFSAE